MSLLISLTLSTLLLYLSLNLFVSLYMSLSLCSHLVLLGPVVDGVPVPGVGGGGAGGPGAPALPLQPRRPVGVQLPAHAVRRAHWQIRFRTLKKKHK